MSDPIQGDPTAQDPALQFIKNATPMPARPEPTPLTEINLAQCLGILGAYPASLGIKLADIITVTVDEFMPHLEAHLQGRKIKLTDKASLTLDPLPAAPEYGVQVGTLQIVQLSENTPEVLATISGLWDLAENGVAATVIEFPIVYLYPKKSTAI